MRRKIFTGIIALGLLFIAGGVTFFVDVRDARANVNSYDDSLVAYWNFNEGTGTTAYDYSGYNNHGTIYGANWTMGISGTALNFDGVDDYVKVPHNDVLTPPDEITISLWFNETSLSPCHSCLIYKAGEEPTSSGHKDRMYTLWACTCWTYMGIHFTSTPKGADSQIWCNSPENVFTLNKFYMLTGVINTTSNSMEIYINGEPVKECSYSGYDNIRSGDYPLRIGACFQTLSDQYNFNGIIDEIRIYNRALSGTEIQSLYYESNITQPPVCTLSVNPPRGPAPLTVTFTITASDPDGSISSWTLDANNDGTAEYSGSGNPPSTQQHTYTNTGAYTARLTVTDNQGATTSGTQILTVSQGPPPEPPIANFTYSTDGCTVAFTDASVDNDGDITTWYWDFGDQQYSTASSPTHEYVEGGNYTVKLTVTDNDGETDSFTRAITVEKDDESPLSLGMLMLLLIVVVIIFVAIVIVYWVLKKKKET